MNTREWIGVNPSDHSDGSGGGSGWGGTAGRISGSGHGVLGIGDNYAGFDAGNGSYSASVTVKDKHGHYEMD